jgi:VanZ family protein
MPFHCTKKKWLAVLTAVIVILILAGSLMPMTDIPEQGKTVWDKIRSVIMNLMHVPMYGALTLALLHYFDCIRFSRPVNAGITAVVAITLGGFIEVLQTHVPGRYFSFSDIGLNAGGMAGAMVLFFRIRGKKGE